MSTVWAGRVIALALVVVMASLVWQVAQNRSHGDPRPIWIEQGEYRGPADATLDPAQVEAITERAQRSNY
jgi:hypothetical protein